MGTHGIQLSSYEEMTKYMINLPLTHLSRRNLTQSVLLKRHALWSGICCSWFKVPIKAPFPTNSSTIRISPFMAAKWRGVIFMLLVVLIEEPASNQQRDSECFNRNIIIIFNSHHACTVFFLKINSLTDWACMLIYFYIKLYIFSSINLM